MGRIYGGVVKRVGEELLTKYPGLFDGDFESNKDKVKTALNTDSKKMVNKVAGYITSKVNSLSKTRASPEGDDAEAVSDPTSDSKQEGIY